MVCLRAFCKGAAYQGGTRRTLADVCSPWLCFFPTRLMHAGFGPVVSVLAPAGTNSTTPHRPPPEALIVSIVAVGLLWDRGRGGHHQTSQAIEVGPEVSLAPCTGVIGQGIARSDHRSQARPSPIWQSWPQPPFFSPGSRTILVRGGADSARAWHAEGD